MRPGGGVIGRVQQRLRRRHPSSRTGISLTDGFAPHSRGLVVLLHEREHDSLREGGVDGVRSSGPDKACRIGGSHKARPALTGGGRQADSRKDMPRHARQRLLKCGACSVLTEPKADRADGVRAGGGTFARIDVAGIQAGTLARELLERFLVPAKSGEHESVEQVQADRMEPIGLGCSRLTVAPELRGIRKSQGLSKQTLRV